MLKLGRVTGEEDIGLPRNLRRTPQEFVFVDSSGDRTSNSTALKEIKIKKKKSDGKCVPNHIKRK